jgi:hypothetical protein
LSTDATIGDTVTAAVTAVTASIASLVTTFFHLVSDKPVSAWYGLDIDVRTLILFVVLAREYSNNVASTSKTVLRNTCNT